MFKSGFKAESAEIQCRLCLGRIKLMRNKRTIQLKQNRKEVAELLGSGKQEYARIRVEGVIREQLMMQAYEILELYVELLAVRSQLVAKTKEIPRDMVEAISSVIYAAERVGDFPELVKLRKMFESKYGPEYVREATNDATRSKWQVNQNLIRCLLVEAPQPEEKLACLSEIAQEHGVEWDLSAAARDLLPPEAPPSMAGPTMVGPGPGLATASVTSVASHASGPGMGAGAGGIPMMPMPGAGAGPHAFGPPHGLGYGMPPHPGAPGTYADASQAAAAAAHAAAQAQAAADYAAQFALHQAGLAAAVPPGQAPLGNGWLTQQAQAQGPPPFPGAPPVPGIPPSFAPDGPAPGPAPTNGGGSGYSSHDTSGGGAMVGPGGQQFVQRSAEEVQRTYDQATGAPEKHSASAPPVADTTPLDAAPDLPRPPSHTPAPARVPPSAPGLNLPPPPAARVQPGAPGSAPEPEDEYEALTRRLEALKRS